MYPYNNSDTARDKPIGKFGLYKGISLSAGLLLSTPPSSEDEAGLGQANMGVPDLIHFRCLRASTILPDFSVQRYSTNKEFFNDF